jgi:hypothetical protein
MLYCLKYYLWIKLQIFIIENKSIINNDGEKEESGLGCGVAEEIQENKFLFPLLLTVILCTGKYE